MNAAIAALRSDRALQRQAQAATDAACRAWREDPAARVAMEDLEAYGNGAQLADCAALATMLTDPHRGRQLVGSLMDLLCRAMKAEPFAHPPFRHGFDGTSGTLLLARSGRAQLLLQTREPGRVPLSSVTFSDAERRDLVLAGSGHGLLIRLSGEQAGTARLDSGLFDLVPDITLALDLSRECLLVEEAHTRLVVLRLLRAAPSPGPVREYDLANGRLLGHSAGHLSSSHRENMMALLAAMDRRDAAPVMAGVALAPGEDSLRWQAIRECLAMDTGTGFDLLCRVAHDEGDPLAGQAGALRAQLVEAHPQLLEWEKNRCPA